MSRRLILVRHGNTFKPQDTPVWVGARTDMPLVDKGIAQAESLAAALRKAGIRPDTLRSGPLRRTRQTAEIVAARLGIAADAIVIDDRLREIDYGAWEGLSSEQIIAAGGAMELAAWSRDAVFPFSPGWQPSAAQIAADTGAVLAEAAAGISLIVTSNGILRFFVNHAVNAAAFPERKVATGHICMMEESAEGWRIVRWNQPPEWLTNFAG